MIGVLMSLFHYPNNVLETGSGIQWVWLELGVDFLQPALLVLGMTYVPLNLKWWGNTTLGCYAFHFYFKDQMCVVIQAVGRSLVWDPTGLLLFVTIIGMCLMFTSILGPMAHYFLISPILVKRFIGSMRRRRDMQRRRSSSGGATAAEPLTPVAKPRDVAIPVSPGG